MPQSSLLVNSDQWLTYRQSFLLAAKEAKWNQSEFNDAIEYAFALYSKGLPIIFDHEHFCLLVGIDPLYILAASNSPSRFYRQFVIRKRAGKERTIAEPLPTLKSAQRWILTHILSAITPSIFSKAYSPGCSIRHNARFHRAQNVVLRIDIADFFPSIRIGRVIGLFCNLGYDIGVATLLGHLCTLNGRLPQGAPTSPAISNLLCHQLDRRLGGFALKHGLRYTRYADDLVFSGDFDPKPVISFAKTVLLDSGFRLRASKTRVMRKYQRQIVPGVVVNEKLQAPKQLRKRVRQIAYYIDKHGLVSHMTKVGETRAHYVEHVLGLMGFILHINPKDAKTRASYQSLLSQLRD